MVLSKTFAWHPWPRHLAPRSTPLSLTPVIPFYKAGGSQFARSQSAYSSSLTSDAARLIMVLAASASSAVKAKPLSSRNTTPTTNPVLLFPSTNE